jgi:hypothetical protein
MTASLREHDSVVTQKAAPTQCANGNLTFVIEMARRMAQIKRGVRDREHSFHRSVKFIQYIEGLYARHCY